ncbi:expressed unknown protein [Seminavis robusta]|uniref:Uncharacterized protein n=1 Tax=Seminavis robusta TaxID=568900 RepID=A0A9N8DNP3_9STRA|nr:expressed unknown protein [Seminavis robusta]|eukprot:Sro249_g098640.1 n/a (476) ;mRNA; r:26369-27914
MDDKNTRSITVKQDDQSDWLIVLVLKHGWMSEDDAQKATTEELKKCVFSRVEKLQGNQNRIYEWEMSVKNSTGLQKFFVETCIGQPFNHEDRNEHFYPDVYRLCRHILDTIHDFKRNGEQPDPSSVFASMQDRGHLNQDNQAAGMHPIAVLLIEAELNPQFTDILKPSKLFTLCYDMMQSKKPGSNIAHPSQLPDEFMRAAYDRLMACGNATFARKASAHLYEVCSKAENRNKILPPDGYRSGSAPGPVRPRRLIDGSTGTVIAEVFRDTNNQRFAPKMRCVAVTQIDARRTVATMDEEEAAIMAMLVAVLSLQVANAANQRGHVPVPVPHASTNKVANPNIAAKPLAEHKTRGPHRTDHHHQFACLAGPCVIPLLVTDGAAAVVRRPNGYLLVVAVENPSLAANPLGGHKTKPGLCVILLLVNDSAKEAAVGTPGLALRGHSNVNMIMIPCPVTYSAEVRSEAESHRRKKKKER